MSETTSFVLVGQSARDGSIAVLGPYPTVEEAVEDKELAVRAFTRGGYEEEDITVRISQLFNTKEDV